MNDLLNAIKMEKYIPPDYYHRDDMNYMLALGKIDKDFNREKLMVIERVMREQRIKNFTNTGKLLDQNETIFI